MGTWRIYLGVTFFLFMWFFVFSDSTTNLDTAEFTTEMYTTFKSSHLTTFVPMTTFAEETSEDSLSTSTFIPTVGTLPTPDDDLMRTTTEISEKTTSQMDSTNFITTEKKQKYSQVKLSPKHKMSKRLLK